MPKRVWGYDQDGELHSFIANALPHGFSVSKPEAEAEEKPKPRGRPRNDPSIENKG